jgi:outer membrane protein OmpA-like peptidoglycan-associated protein
MNNVLALFTLPVGLLTIVGVVLVLVFALWPQGKGVAVWARRAAAVVFTLVGVGGAVVTYHVATLRAQAEVNKNAEALKEMASVKRELSNALAQQRAQDAKIAILERTATEQRQIDADHAAALEADLEKAMKDIGALFSERNGVIELVLKDGVVKFDTDASTLECGGKERLSRVVGAISRVLDAVDSIIVVGHTDLRGTADHNKQLSRERANTVVKYLADSGIPARMMSGKGMSYLQPAGYDGEQAVDVIKRANENDKEMSENRRVQLLIKRKAHTAATASK